MCIGRSTLLLSSEAHTNPPPLNQSLPHLSFLTPLSPNVEPHSLVCVLLCAANWLILASSAPIYMRKINKRENKGVALQKVT